MYQNRGIYSSIQFTFRSPSETVFISIFHSDEWNLLSPIQWTSDPQNAVLWSENHQILASNCENLQRVAILLHLKALNENRLTAYAERHAKATLFLVCE